MWKVTSLAFVSVSVSVSLVTTNVLICNVVWIGKKGFGWGSAAFVIDAVTATIVKTVVCTKINITIVARPGSIKFTARNSVNILGVIFVELSINSSCAFLNCSI
jgi:hypothetical protein